MTVTPRGPIFDLTNDPLYSNRVDTYVVELLNLDFEVIDQLEWSDGSRVGVLPGGTLDFSNATDTRESASLTIVKDRTASVPWQKYRLRISYLGAGFSEPQPLSTLMPTAAPESHPATHVVENLELQSMLAILLRSTMGTTFGVAEGMNVIDAVTDVIRSAGIEYFSIPPSNRVMTVGRTWDPNTTRLKIVNDLLRTAIYWGINTDPTGMLVSSPWVEPAQRPVVFTFDDQPLTGIYMPNWSRDRDLLVPNRCTVIQRVEGNWPPITRSVDLPPEHPQSKENRGYVDERVQVDEDFDDEAAGDALAMQYLGDGLPTESRTFTHLWVPEVVPNSIVIHKRADLPDLRAPVQRQTFHLSTGGLVETRISGDSDYDPNEDGSDV